MNIDEVKREAIYSDSQSRLFEIIVELTEEIARCHVELTATKENTIKAEIKGKISVLSAIQHIIDMRMDDIRTFEKENSRKEFLTNRQFRIAAEIVLTKETYERIRDLSLMNYKKLKDQKTELKANKIE